MRVKSAAARTTLRFIVKLDFNCDSIVIVIGLRGTLRVREIKLYSQRKLTREIYAETCTGNSHRKHSTETRTGKLARETFKGKSQGECASGEHHEPTDMAARASTGPDCRGGDWHHHRACGRVHVPPRPIRYVESMVLVLEQLSMGCHRGVNWSGRRLHTPTCARIDDHERPSSV
jgi:hypothetical protein